MKNAVLSPTPEPLRGSDVGTFAHSSVVDRLPEIGRRTLGENQFPTDVQQEIEALLREIPKGRIRPLNDAQAPDAKAWERYLEPYLGWDWLQVPWFFAEFYFYRRILEASGYFRQGHRGHRQDPFRYQKNLGTKSGVDALARVMEDIQEPQSDPLADLLLIDLWANRADLSMWPMDEHSEHSMPMTLVDRQHLLIDHTKAILECIRRPNVRIDLVLDNTGFELEADLWLAETLLTEELSEIVFLHPKTYPIFVSDAIAQDIFSTLDSMMKSSSEGVRVFALRTSAHLQAGRLQIAGHLFWNSPLAMWEMPEDLADHLALSDLVLFKGDMNYRRLLGDRHWAFDTPFENLMRYFPAPVAAVRTLKAEVACGLGEEEIERAANLDAEWMINGQWGLIQYRG